MPKISPFLWFDGQAEEAAKLYVSIFPNSRLLHVSPMTVSFELDGLQVMALNGGPHFKLNEAFSLFIECKTQEEIDFYWDKLTANGGEESRCGWLKDRFGLSWQVIPTILGEVLGHPEPDKAKRGLEAMMKMQKLDIATLQRAVA